jgi:peptidyl-tRNA hydrolase, PTH2 family
MTDNKNNTDITDVTYKMVFVVRKDLKMGTGKIAAQCCHAAVGLCESQYDTSVYKKWKQSFARKITLWASDLEELESIENNADFMGLPICKISDAGFTQVPNGTVTVLGIGPGLSSDIDKVTGGLKLV